ncbi:MAG: TadE/TadG family type IV pilus assembly protein [Sphingomonadaceae bacterium]
MINIRKLAGNNQGVTLVEFAMIAPALLIMLLGLFELGYNFYVNTQLQGAIQKAARDSTIEGADSKISVIDDRVKSAVFVIVPNATIDFKRTSYTTFSQIGRPEDFTDDNTDGVCNDGEAFEDANGNGSWDADSGTAGRGGARDAVLYEVKVSYPRTFSVVKLIGLSKNVQTSATTILRNQPYDTQQNAISVGECS